MSKHHLATLTETAKKINDRCKLAISQLATHPGHTNPVFRSTAPQTPACATSRMESCLPSGYVLPCELSKAERLYTLLHGRKAELEGHLHRPCTADVVCWNTEDQTFARLDSQRSASVGAIPGWYFLSDGACLWYFPLNRDYHIGKDRHVWIGGSAVCLDNDWDRGVINQPKPEPFRRLSILHWRSRTCMVKLDVDDWLGYVQWQLCGHLRKRR